MRLKTCLLAFVGSLIPAWDVAAEVYRHVDKNGVVHYSDQPPTRDAKPVVLPPIQVIGPIGAGSDASLDQAFTAAAPAYKLSIVSPAADETFRGDDRRLPVSVSMDQPLPDGFGLLYLLDGSAQNTPAVRSLNYTLDGVERGEHLISVAMVDATGREVARAAPVIVHMKPPTVKQASKPRSRPK